MKEQEKGEVVQKMEFNGKGAYFVATKVFLRDGDKLLLVHDKWGNWELPGGRIKPEEFQKPLAEVTSRKMHEELGEDIEYSEPEATGTFFQVTREELGQQVRIFALGFEAQYLRGEIILNGPHDEMKWVDVETFEPLKLQDNDWMRGVQDYLDKIRKEKK